MIDHGLINGAALEAYAKSMSKPDSTLAKAITHYTQENFPNAAHMLSGPLVGRFLQILIILTQAQRVLDIGTFTGYSALTVAESLPETGKVYTCDHDQELLSLAQSLIQESAEARKLEFIHQDALDFLSTTQLIFDLIFLDADKKRLKEYYEAALPKIKLGGILIIDDVLWRGEVLNPQSERAQAIDELNQHIAKDDRVINVLLPIRHGIQLVLVNAQ